MNQVQTMLKKKRENLRLINLNTTIHVHTIDMQKSTKKLKTIKMLLVSLAPQGESHYFHQI